MFTKQTYASRRERLKKEIGKGLILLPGNKEASMNYAANTYAFRQDSNFLYFFGLSHPDMFAVLDCESGEEIIFADELSMDDIIWMGYLPSVKELAAQCDISQTFPYQKLSETIEKALSVGRPIHFVSPYRAKTRIELGKLLALPIEELAAKQSLRLIQAICAQRSIKSVEEIAEIEIAIETAYKMHTTFMQMCKAGVKEHHIAGTMEGIALADNGRVSFPVILSIHGETLHNHNHDNTLSEGRMVLADAGAETAMNYCSDISRTVPVNGKFNTRQKEIYEIVLKANQEVIHALKPGIPYRDYHKQACAIIVEGLKALGIMKGNTEEAVEAGAHALFMPHGLGHMMGLDVHDMENMGENLFGYDDEIKRSTQFGLAYLRLGKRLAPGYVLTVEPGIYFIPALIDLWKSEKKFQEYINFDLLETYKDFGGIRIEDDVLMTESGSKLLGKPIPKTVKEIEEYCAL